MTDAKYSNPIELDITEPSGLNEQAAVALVIAGALVAVADRRVSPVERDEVIRFIRERGLAPHITEERLFAMFDGLACQRASILLFDKTGLMKFVAWRGLSEGYRRAVEGHSPWTREDANARPILIGDIESAELDDSLKQTIHGQRLQSDLLQQTECKISDEASRFHKVSW